MKITWEDLLEEKYKHVSMQHLDGVQIMYCANDCCGSFDGGMCDDQPLECQEYVKPERDGK